jgi:hypothetical protein
VGTILKYHTVGTILRYHTVGTILRYHTVGTILRYHTVGTILRYHTVGTILKYHTVVTIPKSNIKIVERGKIYDRSLSRSDTGTSIKSGEVTLVLWAQTATLVETIR